MEKVSGVISISKSDEIIISHAGLYKNGKALIWFVSGNEYQAHYYLPMECTIAGKDKYVRIYTPVERGTDIVVLEWLKGHAFLINNPNCVAVRIAGEAGTLDEKIEKDSYPYIFYYNGMPSEYAFLDADGNEIP